MKNRNIGIALRLLGFALTAVAALFTLIWFVRDDMHRHPGNLGTWLETALVFVLGTILWRAGHKYSQLGKKHCARSADDLVTKDSRPLLIYLRSFLDDPKTSNEETQWQGGGAGVPSMPSPGPTEEQQLAGIMNQIGPFIAMAIRLKNYQNSVPRELISQRLNGKTEY